MTMVHSDYLEDFNTSTGTGFLRREDGDGKTWLYGTYTNDGVDKTPMQVIVAKTGYSFIDVAAGADYGFVGVPDGTHTSGDAGWIQIGGYIISMICKSEIYTAGHAVILSGGVIECTSAAYDGNAGEFATVITTTSAASTSITAMLNPEEILFGA